MRCVIQFDTQGNARALWTEAIQLGQLGKLRVTRASTVEFNSNLQMWEVILAGKNKPAFRHGSRAECIRWEIETLQQSL